MIFPKIIFYPLIPFWVLIGFGLFYFAFIIWQKFQNQKPNYLHILASSLLLVFCLNPNIAKQKHIDAPLNIGIVKDFSPSIIVTKRTNGIKNISQNLEAKIKEFKNIKIIEEIIPSNANITDYNVAIERILQKSPADEIGAIFIISDGQTKIANNHKFPFPIHQLLAGSKTEEDYYIELIANPVPVKIGENAKIEFIIHNKKQNQGKTKAKLYIDNNIQEIDANLNQKTSLDIKITNRKTLKIAIEAIGSENEISKANNAIITQIKPIEESLKVLLVTGEPYEGARAWRNLLKSDPAIDLIHFTILRSPQKLDNAYEDELALIPFPSEELFIDKLDKFDLIIFDRFENLVGLRQEYMDNIAKYVENGGAFLASLGPRDAIGQGIMATSLKNILPIDGIPKQIDGEFIPTLSQIGKTHPITQNLNGNWGKWDRYFETKAKGQVLMNANQSPLLVIDKFGMGRVAVILSDKSWYWQRNYDGGGPFRELIGRIFYWLMNDEKLSENNLSLQHKDYSIIYDYHYLTEPKITLLDGNNFSQNIKIESGKNQINQEFSGLAFGLYRAIADDNIAFAINGNFEETTNKSLIANGDDYYNSLLNKKGSKVLFQGIKGDLQLPKIEIIENSINSLNNNLVIWNKQKKKIIETQIIPIFDAKFLAIIILALFYLAWFISPKFFRKKEH